MGNLSALRLLLLLLLLLLVSSSRFLLHEARPLHSSTTRGNLVTAVRKSSGGHGSGGGRAHGGYGKAIPLITTGAIVPKTIGVSSHKHKHNAAHSGYNFPIVAFLIISALWL